MSYLPNAQSKPLSRLSIYRNCSSKKKQKEEAMALMPFLLKMDQLVEIDDILFGNDPPDFILNIAGKSIGMEHTSVNPAMFGEGGNRRRKDFKDWQAQVKANPEPVNTFVWGAFTLRQSLESLRNQFRTKCEGASKWKVRYEEKWLLLQLTEGSPFSELTGQLKATPGREKEVSDHQAKVLFEVSSILVEPNPFDHVLIFADCQIIAFPVNGQNPYRLPIPRQDIVARGASVDDSHLDMKSTISHVIRTGSAAFESDTLQ